VKVLADSGPLISLASIALLDVLHSLFHTIHIPQTVYQEVVIAGRGRAGSEGVEHAKWIECHTIKNTRSVEGFIADDGLDRGESEAIVLAKEMNAGLLIVDDRAARKCASRQRLPIIGTAGILLLAKEDHLIPSVKGTLDELLRHSFYLSHSSYRKIVRAAAED
jgi:predicted nucleic acid-binding protein